MRLETLKCVFGACVSEFYSAVLSLRDRVDKNFMPKQLNDHDSLSRNDFSS